MARQEQCATRHLLCKLPSQCTQSWRCIGNTALAQAKDVHELYCCDKSFCVDSLPSLYWLLPFAVLCAELSDASCERSTRARQKSHTFNDSLL